jgi:hypothetical protein
MGMKPTFAYLAPGLLLLFWAFGADRAAAESKRRGRRPVLSLAAGAFTGHVRSRPGGRSIRSVGRR